jgi:hypothetical protein
MDKGNPWVKGYKVAISFPESESDYAQKLFSVLAETIGRDEIFFYLESQKQMRLNSTDLIDSMNIIYKSSTVIVLIYGPGYETGKWCGLEYKQIKRFFFEQEPDRVFLIIEDNLEAPDLFKYYEWANKSKIDFGILTERIKEKIDRNENQDLCEEIKATEEDIYDIWPKKMHTVLTEHLDKGYCFAEGCIKTTENECIFIHTGKAIATLDLTNQKHIALLRVMNKLYNIISLKYLANILRKSRDEDVFKNETYDKIMQYCLDLLNEFKCAKKAFFKSDYIVTAQMKMLKIFLDSYVSEETDKIANDNLFNSIKDIFFSYKITDSREIILTKLTTICTIATRVYENIARFEPIFTKHKNDSWPGRILQGNPIKIKEIPEFVKSYSNKINEAYQT